MFDLLGLLGIGCAIKEIIEEKTTKSYPIITDKEGYYRAMHNLSKKDFEKLVYAGTFSIDRCVKDKWGNKVIEDKETYNFDEWRFRERYIEKWINEGKYNFNTDWYEEYAEKYDLNTIEWRAFFPPNSKDRFTEWKQPECNIKTEEEVRQFELEHFIRDEEE